MARHRIEFRLDVHGSSYRDDNPYLLWRTLGDKDLAALGDAMSWHHSWDDGWGASVSARAMEKGERRRKSAGFQGYDWMVRNILRWGTTRCQCEWRPDPNPPDDRAEWEECVHCRTSRTTEGWRLAKELMEKGEA